MAAPRAYTAGVLPAELHLALSAAVAGHHDTRAAGQARAHRLRTRLLLALVVGDALVLAVDALLFLR